MPDHFMLNPVAQCRTNLVPLRGKATKTVVHAQSFPMAVPVLEEAGAPLAICFRGVSDGNANWRDQHPQNFLHSMTTQHRYGPHKPFQADVRISPRGLPSIPAGTLDDRALVEEFIADEIRLRRYALIRRPATSKIEIEAKEIVSTNVDEIGSYFARRLAGMFVVGNILYTEAAAPFFHARESEKEKFSLVNELPRSESAIFSMRLDELGPENQSEHHDAWIHKAFHSLPCAYGVVCSIVRAVPLGIDEHNPGMTVLVGELAKAAGLMDDRIDLYDWQECRRVVKEMADLSFKTTSAGGIASILDSGVLDKDIVVDVAEMDPEDEGALSLGF